MSQIHKHTIPAEHRRPLPDKPSAVRGRCINNLLTYLIPSGANSKILDWIKPYQKVKNTSFAPGNVSIKRQNYTTLNLAANCLDRHLQENGASPCHHLGRRRRQPEQTYQL
ncbi:hypothetical protein ACLK2F_22945 [Escherichia coli]